MNPSPLPQPAARTCPNCGAAVNEISALCPNCGTALTAASGNGCLAIAGQIFLAFLALVFGLGGACAVLLFGIDGGLSSGGNIGIVLMALLAVALAAACIWGIIRLGKRPK